MRRKQGILTFTLSTYTVNEEGDNVNTEVLVVIMLLVQVRLMHEYMVIVSR